MDESRKQFEAEMEKLGDCVDMRRAKNGDEEYMAWDVSLAWSFWQLSRSAIEIGIPSRINNVDLRTPLEVEDMWRDRMKSTLRAAGIKVKE